jgi:hypothetical protein
MCQKREVFRYFRFLSPLFIVTLISIIMGEECVFSTLKKTTKRPKIRT